MEPSEDETEEEEAEPVKGKGAKANWDAKGSRKKRQVGHGMRVFCIDTFGSAAWFLSCTEQP